MKVQWHLPQISISAPVSLSGMENSILGDCLEMHLGSDEGKLESTLGHKLPKSCWKGKMNPEFKTDFKIKFQTTPVLGEMLQQNGLAPHHNPGPSFCSLFILKGLLSVVALRWETNSGDTVPECWLWGWISTLPRQPEHERNGTKAQ